MANEGRCRLSSSVPMKTSSISGTCLRRTLPLKCSATRYGVDMEYRRLSNSDLKVSALSLGTMTFGEQNNEAEAHAQLDLAVAHGVNFIDTAEMYPVAPRAETVHRTESHIGTWLKRQPRDRLIVATKIAGPARGFSWIRNGPRI